MIIENENTGAISGLSLAAGSQWQAIETLDKSRFHFVLVYENGAMRALLWCNDKKHWLHPTPDETPLSDGDSIREPTHWMELPEPPSGSVEAGHASERKD